jgi:hypothetical protein
MAGIDDPPGDDSSNTRSACRLHGATSMLHDHLAPTPAQSSPTHLAQLLRPTGTHGARLRILARDSAKIRKTQKTMELDNHPRKKAMTDFPTDEPGRPVRVIGRSSKRKFIRRQ